MDFVNSSVGNVCVMNFMDVIITVALFVFQIETK